MEALVKSAWRQQEGRSRRKRRRGRWEKVSRHSDDDIGRHRIGIIQHFSRNEGRDTQTYRAIPRARSRESIEVCGCFGLEPFCPGNEHSAFFSAPPMAPRRLVTGREGSAETQAYHAAECLSRYCARRPICRACSVACDASIREEGGLCFRGWPG